MLQLIHVVAVVPPAVVAVAHKLQVAARAEVAVVAANKLPPVLMELAVAPAAKLQRLPTEVALVFAAQLQPVCPSLEHELTLPLWMI